MNRPGPLPDTRFFSVPQSFLEWSRLDRCNPQETVTRIRNSTMRSVSGCANGVGVALLSVSAASQRLGGHVLYRNDDQINLAATAWAFLDAR